MAKKLCAANAQKIVPKGEKETIEDFHFRETFQPFCSRPVLPRTVIEDRGEFINRVLLSRDDTN